MADFYALSYSWYSAVAWLVTVSVALLVSFITGQSLQALKGEFISGGLEGALAHKKGNLTIELGNNHAHALMQNNNFWI